MSSTALNILDTVRRVETPEGVVLELRVAGPLARFGAWLIDLLLRGVIYLISIVFVAFLGEAGVGIWFIFIFLMEWFYPVVFEVKWRGRTPGKAVLNLAVVHDDGTPVGWSASILRNLLRAVDMLPGVYLFGLVACCLHPNFKRLGDMAAGTLVIYQDRVRWSDRMPKSKPQLVPLVLSIEEQRALIDYAERSATWSPERRRELASILVDLAGPGEKNVVARLQGMAQSLMGRP